jgi:hypothetical protein
LMIIDYNNQHMADYWLLMIDDWWLMIIIHRHFHFAKLPAECLFWSTSRGCGSAWRRAR